MDEYDSLASMLKLSSGSVYLYGSYSKESHVRGVSDLDVIVFTEDEERTLEELKSINIPRIYIIRLDLRIVTPEMNGIELLHAFLATRYGQKISGKEIEIELSEEDIKRFSKISASSVYQIMLRKACMASYLDRSYVREWLSDTLLTISLLYLINQGYLDVTKPEILDYKDEFSAEEYKILTRAYRYRYANVRRGKEIDLLRVAKSVMKRFK